MLTLTFDHWVAIGVMALIVVVAWAIYRAANERGGRRDGDGF